MMTLTDENKFILIQFFLEEDCNEHPKVHSKKREKRQGALINEIDALMKSYEELNAGIDLIPYKEILTYLRKVKGKEAYTIFIDDLLSPYE